jgi:tRNA(Arg) A34 adenosine deaminase TadA
MAQEASITMLSHADWQHLRHAMRLASAAAQRGNRPFGAVIVDRHGELLAAAENSTVTDDDIRSHAELNAMREVCRSVGQSRLLGATIYANTEPCPMCAGAIVRFGLRRVVFGTPLHEVMATLPSQVAAVHVSVAAITALASHHITVIGPCEIEPA